MQENWFKDWFNTPYYHLLYKNRDEQEAANFIDKLLSHLRPAQNSKMLDVACGKGRHAIQMSNKGFDVTGIDLSEESIQIALESENDQLHFYKHDMRTPFWINYFDYAFNFFTSFGYFKTERENNNAIQSIASALNQNGIFVIDYINSKYAEQKIVHKTELDIDGIFFTITRWYDDQKFYKKILVEDPSIAQPISFTEEVARFTTEDFSRFFKKNNLVIKEIFGDYQLNSFKEDSSERLIIIAQKVL